MVGASLADELLPYAGFNIVFLHVCDLYLRQTFSFRAKLGIIEVEIQLIFVQRRDGVLV
jgi:hypothetical protein